MIEPIDLGIPGLTNIERIGTGGNAVVYRARQDDLDRSVVVKVLMNIDAETTRRRFDRERRAMGRLSQAVGIAPLYGSGFTPSGQPYLLMPFYEQGSLHDLMQQTGALPADQVRDIGVIISRAVQTAHENGVLHRDIKPANILLRRSGQPDVADFGIAHLTDDALGTSQALTMTPLYTAPEVFDGVESGAASDVYSLGATLFALLNGYPAYGDPQGGTPVLSLMRRINEDPLPALPAHVPRGLSDAIATAMSKNVSDRYRSAGEFAAALAAADMSPPKPASRSRLVVAAVVLAGLLATGGAVAAWSFLGSTDDGTETAQPTAVPVGPTAITLPTPTPVEPGDSTPAGLEGFDLAVAADASRQALVRVEAFSCTGAQVAVGVVLNDGIIVTTSDVLASPWRIEVTNAGTSYTARAQTATSVKGFGFIRLDESDALAPLSGATVVDGEEIALVGIDGRPALATVTPSAGPDPLLVLSNPGNGNAVEPGDVAITRAGGLAGIVAVEDGVIELIVPGRLQDGVRTAPQYGCDTTVRELTAADSESAVAPAIGELLLMQHLNNAYAQENWDLVRVLEPSKVGFPVANFELGWQALTQGFVYPVDRSVDAAGLSRWRIGLIGHERWNDQEVTTLFCVTWRVDPVSGAITQTFDEATTVYGVADDTARLAGFADPGDLRSTVTENC